jgi:hypothetical protein
MVVDLVAAHDRDEPTMCATGRSAATSCTSAWTALLTSILLAGATGRRYLGGGVTPYAVVHFKNTRENVLLADTVLAMALSTDHRDMFTAEIHTWVPLLDRFGTVQWIEPKDYLASQPDAVVLDKPMKTLQARIGSWLCAYHGHSWPVASVSCGCGDATRKQRLLPCTSTALGADGSIR